MVKRILVADDSRTFREYEAAMLRSNGYALIQAEDGAQAVKEAALHKPDLILLDYQMPLVSGMQALILLKSNPETAGIPVVVITTTSLKENSKQFEQRGAARCLNKPVSGPELLQVVRELIGRAEHG